MQLRQKGALSFMKYVKDNDAELKFRRNLDSVDLGL